MRGFAGSDAAYLIDYEKFDGELCIRLARNGQQTNWIVQKSQVLDDLLLSKS
jgi:hypothetical protein